MNMDFVNAISASDQMISKICPAYFVEKFICDFNGNKFVLDNSTKDILSSFDKKIVVLAGRRTGKTTAAILFSIWKCLFHKCNVILLMRETYKNINMIKAILTASGIDFVLKGRDFYFNGHVLSIENINFFGRGYGKHYDLYVYDEYIDYELPSLPYKDTIILTSYRFRNTSMWNHIESGESQFKGIIV